MDNVQKIYVEKPLTKVVSRRTFFKILGIGAATLALTSYKLSDIVVHRNRYIKMRQTGLYKDDSRVREKLHLAESSENPMIKQFYQQFAHHPLSHVSESLLHTTYQSRANIIKLFHYARI